MTRSSRLRIVSLVLVLLLAPACARLRYFKRHAHRTDVGWVVAQAIWKGDSTIRPAATIHVLVPPDHPSPELAREKATLLESMVQDKGYQLTSKEDADLFVLFGFGTVTFSKSGAGPVQVDELISRMGTISPDDSKARYAHLAYVTVVDAGHYRSASEIRATWFGIAASSSVLRKDPPEPSDFVSAMLSQAFREFGPSRARNARGIRVYYDRGSFHAAMPKHLLESIDFDVLAPGTRAKKGTFASLSLERLNVGCPLAIEYRCGNQRSESLVIVREGIAMPSTTGPNLLSPGGPISAKCNRNRSDNDDLAVVFEEPTQAFGLDIIYSQRLPISPVGVRVLDPSGSVLFEKELLPTEPYPFSYAETTKAIVKMGSGLSSESSLYHELWDKVTEDLSPGSQFVGFVSERTNISRIEIDEYNGSCTKNFTFDVGYDSIVFLPKQREE